MRAAVLGGTGPFGRGLAFRLAGGGAEVVVGSRDRRRAEATAADLSRRLKWAASAGGPVPPIGGTTNREAAGSAEAVFLAAPFAAQDALLRELGVALEDRLVICCAVLWPPGSRPDTSAAEEAERTLAAAGVRRTRLAAAFQTVAAGTLAAPLPPESERPADPPAPANSPAGADSPATARSPLSAPAADSPVAARSPAATDSPAAADSPDTPDVLVFADRDEDRAAAARAAARTGLRAVPAGPLRGVRAAEAAVGLLLELGRRGTARHPGVRITGVAAPSGEPG